MERNMERFEYLAGYEFSGCSVRRRDIISFYGQKWSDDDSLEIRPTGIFFYYPEKPKERQWAYREVGDSTGIHGCAAFFPNERWVFVMDDGQVYIVGGGDDDFEKQVTNKKNAFFSNVKSIRGGHAICVGPRRKVFVRMKSNQWVQLDNGLFPQGEKTNLENSGFSDIDGFSESDMYACGGHGDLWKYDGKSWSQISIPTNAVLKNICCGNDGYVYITTNGREILEGRDHEWSIIQQDETKRVLESIVDFQGRILVSTVSDIYEVSNHEVRKADLGDMPVMRSKAHLASGDGILVVAGRNEAAVYDGASWKVILEPEA